MDKEDVVYIYIYIYIYIYWNISHKKNEILPFEAKCIDLENIMLSEICHTENDNYYIIQLICGIQKIKQTNS